MVEVMETMVTSFKRFHAVLLQSMPPTLQQAATDPRLRWRLLDPPGQVWVSLLWGHCSFLLGPGAHRFLLCPPRFYFPVLCKFWQLYGGVNGDLLQEGLCHTQVCCTRIRCPCGRPLLTHTSTGDTQTQFCISLCGVSGSWCAQGMFELSEHHWRVWGLILNVISSILSFCWGFSFAPGYAYLVKVTPALPQLPLQHLPSCWGFSVNL